MSTMDEPQSNKRQSATIEIETTDDTAHHKEISSNKKYKLDRTRNLTETTSSSTSSSAAAYVGYQFNNNKNNDCHPTIDVIDIDSITSDEFFNLYISKRKPCILNLQSSSSSSSSKPNNNTNTTIPKNHNDKDENERLHIVQSTFIENVVECMLAVETSTTNDDPIIQIEKRLTSIDLFGQNRTPDRQILLKLTDFVRLMLDMNPHSKQYDSKNLYYLSTQTSTQQQQSTSSGSTSILINKKRPNMNDRNNDSSTNKNNNEEEEKEKDTEMIYPLPFDTNPCQLLLQENIIPDTFPLAGSLVLDSCNLWMGSVDNTNDSNDKDNSTINGGSNSGLHHDYHDNFYWLLCGQKKFAVFPPNTYNNMYLYGTNPTIQSNGVISYSKDKTRVNKNSSAKAQKHDIMSDDDDDDNEEESEVLLGKGFDYKSDNDSDDVDFDGKDDFDELCQSDEYDDSDDDSDEASVHDDNNNSRRPNNFSRIDMSKLNNRTIEKEFPLYRNSQEQQCEFTLQHDQCLYLPASWFHCVTSFGSDTKNIPVRESTSTSSNNNSIKIPTTLHAAINYWYHPPDNLDNITSTSTDPYTDKAYWEEHRKEVADHIMSIRNREGKNN